MLINSLETVSACVQGIREMHQKSKNHNSKNGKIFLRKLRTTHLCCNMRVQKQRCLYALGTMNTLPLSKILHIDARKSRYKCSLARLSA